MKQHAKKNDSTLKINPKPITFCKVAVNHYHEFFGFLPERQHMAFSYCFFLHDQILATLNYSEEIGVFSHEIKLQTKLKKVKDDELMHWLNANGYKIESSIVAYKMTVLALLSDMLHFIYEAIDCTRKLKVQVAYALLRRPLKDNLFYLEFMLADIGEFIKQLNFNENEPIIPVEKVDKAKKIELITLAMEKYENKFFYTPELLHRIRYDKSCMHGFEYLFQKANHLVTTFRQYKTEPCNFNFIFPGEGFLHEGCDMIFAGLPLMLLHTLQLSTKLISLFRPFDNDHPVSKYLDAKTQAGFILWYLSYCEYDFFNLSNFILTKEEIRAIYPIEILNCSRCGKQMTPSLQRLAQFYKTDKLRCSKCRKISTPFGDKT